MNRGLRGSRAFGLKRHKWGRGREVAEKSAGAHTEEHGLAVGRVRAGGERASKGAGGEVVLVRRTWLCVTRGRGGVEGISAKRRKADVFHVKQQS